MKFKNKILLASASLLVLSGAAASTGVFAWYTANRAAEVKVTTMTATSTEGALAIAGGDKNKHGVEIKAKDSSADSTDPDLTIKPESDAYLVDVTGNGDGTFNKPFYAKESNLAGMVGHWDSESAYQANYSEKAFYYYSFDLKFSIKGGDGSYGLLLSKSCKLTDNDATTTVADTVRLSAVNGSRHVYANINGDDAGYYTYSDSVWADATIAHSDDQGVLTKMYFTGNDGSTFSTTDDNYLGSITANGDLTVTFYVWVEGHASANTGAAADLAAAGDSSATFNLNLKFYTLKAKA